MARHSHRGAARGHEEHGDPLHRGQVISQGRAIDTGYHVPTRSTPSSTAPSFVSGCVFCCVPLSRIRNLATATYMEHASNFSWALTSPISCVSHKRASTCLHRQNVCARLPRQFPHPYPSHPSPSLATRRLFQDGVPCTSFALCRSHSCLPQR